MPEGPFAYAAVTLAQLVVPWLAILVVAMVVPLKKKVPIDGSHRFDPRQGQSRSRTQSPSARR
jgi:type IV secretory pathway component VirB8